MSATPRRHRQCWHCGEWFGQRQMKGNLCRPCNGRIGLEQIATGGRLFGAPRIRGLCVYCGGVAHTRDHVIPLSRGGTNAPDNLVPACRPCNGEKGSLLVDEWKAKRLAAGLPWPPTRDRDLSAERKALRR